ncbi:recombinase family protein [Dyella flagellata]|uniref:Site-specific recombinase n=1 Tax=Dyella flagellata TaxID=1867833 RepID=A0ABQ5XJ40_9GAMM|nr:recombinase family protein [Dyella flagellata]GLQ90651.1 site-specific recombinase [Dyella flagellata]
MPKGYVYVRYSTVEQGQGDSVERQLRLARQFAESRTDLHIEIDEDVTFIDRGVSSFTGDNLAADKALGQFLAAVDRGEILSGSFLLVESLDRLSRQEIAPAQRVFLNILNRGITVATTSPVEVRVYDSKAGLIDLIVMLTHMERAHAESALKSKRVKAAWDRKRDKARDKAIITRVCPQWLTVSPDGTHFIVNEERAEVVRKIFACAESMGYQSIARYLNETGVRPFSPRSKGWQSSRIVKILLSPAVIGTFQPGSITHVQTDDGLRRRVAHEGVPIENYYPAIIDVDLFNRVQVQKASRAKHASGRKGKAIRNLFSHVATCGSCGNNMVLVQKGPAHGAEKYLVCSIARRGAGCAYYSWPYDPLEEAFLNYCQNIDLSEITYEGSPNNKLVQLRKKVLALRGSKVTEAGVIERLMADVGKNGGVMPKAVQTYLLKAEDKLENLTEELKSTELELAQEEERLRERKSFKDMFGNVMSQLESASTPEKLRLRAGLQRIIRSAVTKMELFRSPPEHQAEWRNTFGKDIPTINRVCVVAFQVGIEKLLFFSHRKLVYVLDKDDDFPFALNGQNVTLTVDIKGDS